MVATNSTNTRYAVPTSAGNLFFPMSGENGTLPTVPVDKDGRTERYVTELEKGDKIYLEGEGVPEDSASFSDIRGILSANVPGYRQARAANFIEHGFPDEKRTYEVPRLKYDLWHAVAAQNPSLLAVDELARLDECIFERPSGENNAYGFSGKTVSEVAAYIEGVSKAACEREGVPWKYTKGTQAAKDWLNGSVIHPRHKSDKPEDLEDAIWIGYALGSDELMSRSFEIYDAAVAAQENPAAKDANDYFRLTDGHSNVARLMRGMMGEHKQGERESAHVRGNHGRVYSNTREWADAVRRELKARIQHGIREIQVYDKGKLVEVGTPADEPEPHARGMTRKPVLITSDERRADVYDMLGITSKPPSRRDTLRGALMDAADIMTIAYGKIVQAYLDFKSRPAVTVTAGVDFRLSEIEGKRYVILRPDFLTLFAAGVDATQLYIDNVNFAHGSR
ncbi:MAG: hypothetical protein HY365_02200, partial [Candidatus Aenigmarchaeota archaeon]|nr:hypothetical protein [Candidatus Aenigmarchaeota archaeon]